MQALLQKVLKCAACLSAFAAIATTPDLGNYARVEGNFLYRPTDSNALSLGHSSSILISEDWGAYGGLSIAQKYAGDRELGFRLGGAYKAADFYFASLTLFQNENVTFGTGTSTALLNGEMRFFLVDAFGISVSVGWWERLQRFSGTALHSRDWAFAFEALLRPTETWQANLSFANFTEFEVDNLQNPHFGLTLKYLPEKYWGIEAYARYRVYAGFGRLDAFTTGLALRYARQ